MRDETGIWDKDCYSVFVACSNSSKATLSLRTDQRGELSQPEPRPLISLQATCIPRPLPILEHVRASSLIKP